MKKRVVLLLLACVLLLLLAACGSAGKNKSVNGDTSDPMSDEEAEANAINEAQSYSTHLGNIFTSSNKLQDIFAKSLDGLYTDKTSRSQFAKIITENIIETSRELVESAEGYNFPTDFFEINQQVVSSMNTQHQIFLDAVSEANDPNTEIDRNGLRERLVDLKQEQLSINNNWKQM